MALIKKLVEWRLESLIREFDINMKNFSMSAPMREQNWSLLGEKIIPRDYITSEKNIGRICILIIHNIIWKNIVTYKFEGNEWHSHMLHINYTSNYTFVTYNVSMTRDYLLKNYIASRSYENNEKLENIIINYLMLINPIITEFLIVDLSNIIKMYMFDAILTI